MLSCHNSICLTPPPPSSAFVSIWPTPLYQCIKGKNTFWYEIIKAFWLFRTKKHMLWQSWINLSLLHTFLALINPCYQIYLWLNPPSSAIVSIWLTPPPPLVSNRQHLAYPLPPPLAADVICGQPLTCNQIAMVIIITTCNNIVLAPNETINTNCYRCLLL